MRRLAIAALVALTPATASAVNGMRPRTPALFVDTPCITKLDKAVDDPIVHIEYGVPMDDIDVGSDEVVDSRTMQFFAFAQQRWNFVMPVWITQADYDRSFANGDVTKMYTDDEILEKSSLWPIDTWVRITPDDARLPITMDQAAMGVDWDITDVHVGTWMVAVYTWEPEQNLWSHRFGAYRIEDSAAPEEDPGPTVFLQNAEVTTAEVDVPYAVNGCMEAKAGSLYTASYGPIVGINEPIWVPFVTDAPVVNGDLQLEFIPPMEAAGTEIKVRVEIQEPSSLSYTAYTPAAIPVTCTEGCDGGSSGGETETGDSSDSDPTVDPTFTTNDSDDSSNANSEDENGGMGFGCRTAAPAPIGAAFLLLLLGLSPRGRRRC